MSVQNSGICTHSVRVSHGARGDTMARNSPRGERAAAGGGSGAGGGGGGGQRRRRQPTPASVATHKANTFAVDNDAKINNNTRHTHLTHNEHIAAIIHTRDHCEMRHLAMLAGGGGGGGGGGRRAPAAERARATGAPATVTALAHYRHIVCPGGKWQRRGREQMHKRSCRELEMAFWQYQGDSMHENLQTPGRWRVAVACGGGGGRAEHNHDGV